MQETRRHHRRELHPFQEDKDAGLDDLAQIYLCAPERTHLLVQDIPKLLSSEFHPFNVSDIIDESSERAPDSLYLWVGHHCVFRVKLMKASLKGKRERARDNKYFEMWNILVRRFHFSHDNR